MRDSLGFFPHRQAAANAADGSGREAPAQSPDRAAAALQLAAALHAYDEELDALLRHGMDPVGYRQVTQRMDGMRLLATGLPEYTASWVDVLIRHFEVTQSFWAVAEGKMDPAELTRVRRLERAAVALLQQRLAGQDLAEGGAGQQRSI